LDVYFSIGGKVKVTVGEGEVVIYCEGAVDEKRGGGVGGLGKG
jgi:hypothetical protein